MTALAIVVAVAENGVMGIADRRLPASVALDCWLRATDEAP